MTNYTEFTKKELNLGYVNALATLIKECEKENIEIRKVLHYMNGFIIFFEGFKGDAILHDGSYGREIYSWETIGMPWDYDDVSVHTAKELAILLGQLKRGEWKEERRGV